MPDESILNRHVDANELSEITDPGQSLDAIAHKLAPSLNMWYLKASNPAIDPATADEEFAKLEETYKQASFAQARRIPDILAAVHLEIVPTSKPGISPISNDIIEKELACHLELLAEAEHNGWMIERMKDGWTLAGERDNSKKKHNLLIPYNQLAEEQKEKDRNAIRSYTVPGGFADLLRDTGYSIVKSP